MHISLFLGNGGLPPSVSGRPSHGPGGGSLGGGASGVSQRQGDGEEGRRSALALGVGRIG